MTVNGEGNASLEALVKDLAKKVERLEIVEKELRKLKDTEEIKCLMNKYGRISVPDWVMLGYYMDKQLYKQVAQLFSTRKDVRAYCFGGIWVGPEGISRMYVRSPISKPVKIVRFLWKHVHTGTQWARVRVALRPCHGSIRD